MMITDSDIARPRRGAPKGNRNAWKHGRRSSAAKAERAAARAALIAALPDPGLFDQIAEHSAAEFARLGWDAEISQILPNKTNNSVLREAPEQRPPSPNFSENKTNNSLVSEGGRRRGAPKGNGNALKNGHFSGKGRQFHSSLRQLRRRIEVICDLALVWAKVENNRSGPHSPTSCVGQPDRLNPPARSRPWVGREAFRLPSLPSAERTDPP